MPLRFRVCLVFAKLLCLVCSILLRHGGLFHLINLLCKRSKSEVVQLLENLVVLLLEDFVYQLLGSIE